MKKPTANMLNGEKLILFLPRSETRQGCSFSLLLCNIVIEVLGTAIRQEKGIHIGKVEVNLLPYADEMIPDIENPKNPPKKNY